MRNLLSEIQNEASAKAQIASVYPPDLVAQQFDRMINRKRREALRTAETVLIILKEID